MTYKLKVLYSPMNILTEGKDCYQKTKVNTMQRTSSVALFHGKSLKFIGYLGILGLLAGASLSTAAARERDLLDAGWTFQLGDPVDVTTAVTSYPEIGDLTKLQDPTQKSHWRRHDPIRWRPTPGKTFRMYKPITTTVPGASSICRMIGWWNCLSIRTQLKITATRPGFNRRDQHEHDCVVSAHVHPAGGGCRARRSGWNLTGFIGTR